MGRGRPRLSACAVRLADMRECSIYQRSASASGVHTLYSRAWRYHRVVPRLVHMKRPQNVRFSISETRDRAAAVRLVTVLRESIIIPGLCRRMSVAVVGLVCSDQLS